MSNAGIRTLTTALLRAEQFIVNGIEWGFISMPEDKGDPAHDTLPMIRAAIKEADRSLIQDEENQVIGCSDEKPGPRPLSAGMVAAMREIAHSPGRGLKEPIEENDCPGHVASETDSKVCARCGTHIDSLRPDGEQP